MKHRKVRARRAVRPALLVLVAGVPLVTSSAPASALGAVVSMAGELNTVQQGQQNRDCGNSADLVTVNVAGDMVRRARCVEDDHPVDRTDSGHGSGHELPTVLGGNSAGSQINTAQRGRQNLHCGNSADTVTVNLLGTIEEETECRATAPPRRSGRSEAPSPKAVSDDAVRTEGGVSGGSQINTAQSGRQNLHCGNSADTVTVNLGAIRKKVTCVAEDTPHNGARYDEERHRVQAESGTSPVSESSTAQNGWQNVRCGNKSDLLDPLGKTERTTVCLNKLEPHH
ncbi:hypothetical protein [Streptomyces sp. NEAU-NA10]|uniref:hypothetical protein n=1 Tax=Streptomyces sp. NEAU-NA10 TaxID=3416050 RepID=UPI003CC5B1F8